MEKVSLLDSATQGRFAQPVPNYRCLTDGVQSMTDATIFHYTTLNTLALILKSRKFRLNRLDKVNDPLEAEKYSTTVFKKRFYVSCWTKNSEESIPLWKLYGGDLKGVRIEATTTSLFNLKFAAEAEAAAIIQGLCPSFFEFEVGKLKYDLFDVDYNDDKQEQHENYGFSSHFDGKGYTPHLVNIDWPTKKHRHWGFEKEFRFAINAVGSSYPKKNEEKIGAALPEYIDLSLSDAFFSTFKLTLGPASRDGEKSIVNALLEKHADGFVDSRLQESLVRLAV